jgi:hypothetical protein
MTAAVRCDAYGGEIRLMCCMQRLGKIYASEISVDFARLGVGGDDLV